MARAAILRSWRGRRRRLAGGLAFALLVVGMAMYGLFTAPAGLPIRVRLDESGGATASLAFSPDGATLATGHPGGNVRLWDARTGALRSKLKHHQSLNLSAVFSADGRRLAVRSTDLTARNSTVAVFEVEGGRLLARLDLPGPFIVPWMAFAPDGSTLSLIARDHSARSKTPLRVVTWDAETWTVREDRPLPGKPADLLAIAPDGLTAAASGDRNTGAVVLRDVASGTEIAPLVPRGPAPPAGVITLAFSPDGATLAIGREDGSLELWDVAGRRLREKLRGHSHGYAPQTVAFGPSRAIVSSAADWGPSSAPAQLAHYVRSMLGGPRQRNYSPPEVVLWDVASGRPRAKLRGEFWPLLSPDGRTLATTGERGIITLWDVSPAAGP